MRRDIAERGRTLEGVITQYNKFVKPSYNEWVEPSKRFADIIIPNIGDSVNVVAVNLICEHVKLQLRARAAKAPGSSRRAGSLDVFRGELREPTNREMSAAGLLVQYTTASFQPDMSPPETVREPRKLSSDGGPMKKVYSGLAMGSSSEAGSEQEAKGRSPSPGEFVGRSPSPGGFVGRSPSPEADRPSASKRERPPLVFRSM